MRRGCRPVMWKRILNWCLSQQHSLVRSAVASLLLMPGFHHLCCSPLDHCNPPALNILLRESGSHLVRLTLRQERGFMYWTLEEIVFSVYNMIFLSSPKSSGVSKKPVSPEPKSWAGSSIWEQFFSVPLWTITRARLSTGVRKEVVLRRRAPVERLVCSAASWDISCVTNTCFNAATDRKARLNECF